jgi:hypothetical protein
VADTGFRHAWHSLDDDRYFSAGAASVDPDVIATELAKPDGRRAFHPARAILRGLRPPAPGPSDAVRRSGQ